MDQGSRCTMQEKALLRAVVRARLDSAPPERFEGGGVAAAECVRASSAWRGAGTVLLYLSMAREACCDDLIQSAIKDGKAVYLPRVSGADLAFIKVTRLEGPWERGPLGIREPIPGKSDHFKIGEPNGSLLVVVPGLAFDTSGGRLGRGKGYYDRFLSRLGGTGLRLGFCIHEQLVEGIPMDGLDSPMDAVVCDLGFRYVRSPSLGF